MGVAMRFSSIDPITAAAADHWRSTVATLLQGCRGAAFLKIRHADIPATFSQLIGLTGIDLLLQFVHDFLMVGPQGELTPFGLPSLLFKVPVILFAAWAVCALLKKTEATLALAVAICAMSIPIETGSAILLKIMDSRVLSAAFGRFDWSYLLYQNLAPAWLGMAAAVAGRRFFALPPKPGLAAMLPAFLLVWAPLSQIGTWGSLWTKPYNQESYAQAELQRNPLRGERAFYSQQRALDKALASLVPGSPEAAHVYFVGVAGDSHQDVFMKEVHYAAGLFKAHFDTVDRSIMLINNAKTVLDTPIASVTSLGLALKQVGKVMNPEKDILFLYLTAHGSKTHRLSLSFGDMRFEALDPPTLRRLLDDARIKRRVVVVSACYSGGFIEPLKDPDTLIITASAADRTSHGCSNEADFTFFGRAYFQDGLRKTDSFIDAFNIAMPLIASRETRDDYSPADPQIYVGAGIGAAIDQYVEQRKARARADEKGLRKLSGPARVYTQ